MSSRLEEAKSLKEFARKDIDVATIDKNNIDLERLREKALPRLDKATKIFEADYQEIENGKSKIELRRELADCYGMKGGVYRRLSESGELKENLEKAARMYEEGRKYEVDDSYNLSNSVVIPILINPENLERNQADIKVGLVKIEELVRGKKKYDWYAWTDLGLFYLLSNEFSAARAAYEQATQLGAGPPNYKSTLSVLEQLERALNEAKPPTTDTTSPIAKSIGEIIKLLNEEKSKLFQ